VIKTRKLLSAEVIIKLKVLTLVLLDIDGITLLIVNIHLYVRVNKPF
jgi:hypothetical protein